LTRYGALRLCVVWPEKALDLDVPSTLLARAHEVIE
jgi:hypothetical protein